MLVLSPETRDPDEAAAIIADFREATGPLGTWLDRLTAGG